MKNFNVKNPWLKSDEFWIFLYEGKYDFIDDPVMLICYLMDIGFPVSDFRDIHGIDGDISVEYILEIGRREVFIVDDCFAFVRVNNDDVDIFSEFRNDFEYAGDDFEFEFKGLFYYDIVEPVVKSLKKSLIKSLKRNVIIDELFED